MYSMGDYISKKFYNDSHDDRECKDKGNDIVLVLKF